MSLKNILNEKAILPLSDIITGENVSYFLRILKETEKWDNEQIHVFQDNRLKLLFNVIFTKVPYYKEWIKENGLTPSDFKSREDLRKLPIVDKPLMQKEGNNRFYSEQIPSRKSIDASSSGSTGEPFSYSISKEAHSINNASKILTWYKAGYRLGDKYMKIVNRTRINRIKKLQDKLNNCIFVPFYSIKDETFSEILQKIEDTEPTIIRSYPLPLYLLAKYRNNNPGYSFCPQHIMTTGSTLSDDYRIEIEKAFGCDIIDSYSCEGTPNIYETPAHDGYNICEEYAIVEVLNDTDEPIANGIGRIVSTDLWNLAHPFIRYNTQDLAEVKDGRIVRIMGRECESITTQDGERFTMHTFGHFFIDDVTSVTAYQIIKHKNNTIDFHLEVTDRYNDETRAFIIKYWQDRLKYPINIIIEDNIPIMNNNKRLTIINE